MAWDYLLVTRPESMSVMSEKGGRAANLVDWAHQRLTALGRCCAGAPDLVRERPWATVARLPTDQGPVWAKAAAAPFAYEVPLLGLLDRHAPGSTPAVLALDPAGARALLADGGPTWDVVHAAGLAPGAPQPRRGQTVRAWTAMLERYARTQQALAGRIEELLAAGLPDLRPGLAAAGFAELVDRTDLLRVGGVHGITAGEAAAVRALVPLAAGAAHRLAGSAVPATVQHDDLQPGNVVGDGALIDWGDACVAHPFASLLTALGGSSGRPAAGDHEAIRDAYLRQFVAGAGARALDDLREQARLAVLLAPVGRIRAWLRMPEALEEHPDLISLWWRRILADRSWDRLR
jgi:hypothetical protein